MGATSIPNRGGRAIGVVSGRGIACVAYEGETDMPRWLPRSLWTWKAA